MSRQMVEQVQCDRCGRVELRPVASDPAAKKPPVFEARFGELTLLYPDVCTFCMSSLTRLWSELKEWERELKQGLLGPAVPNNQAAPVSSAPNYTPPKPHLDKK